MLLPTPKNIQRTLGKAGSFAQNALEVARLGGLETGEEPAPNEVHADERVFRLLRYLPDAAPIGERPPIILVPPMMLAADVYDVSADTSAVRELSRLGVDPWVVDFGDPERIEGATKRTLTDHVLAVSEAVDRVRELTGRDVHLSGYSQGGMFCYQAAAYRKGAGIASLVTFGSPVDTHLAVPFGLPVETVTKLLAGAASLVFAERSLPGWMASLGFKLLDPVKSLRGQLDFLLQLHDRDALLAREQQRRFLDGEGFVGWAGPALAEFVEQFVEHNKLLSGGFQIDDRIVTLADVELPVLCFTGEVDEIAPARTVRAIRRAAPRADLYELSQRTGHFGMVVGSRSVRVTWPAVAGWIEHCEHGTDLPDGIEVLVEDRSPDSDDPTPDGNDLLAGLQFLATVGIGATRGAWRTAGRAVATVSDLAEGAWEQLPRLVRLERATRDTTISLGLVLAEQTREGPNETFFLFEDRAHTFTDATHRIDAVVRGLLEVGVRQGEHVGVLMHTRPSALAVVAAISRLGAVGVLLRPDGDPRVELALGGARRLVVDPEHLAEVRALGLQDEVQVLALGGGGQERDLGDGVLDMERIDPDAVLTPGWYRANPGRADDLAFVLFTGQGDQTRRHRISNRRWSLSAFGTASAARLGEDDTVYSTTPIHHPSGLLTGIGGAIAGGARLALGTGFDPDTFWNEVRRYGATVVPYTWSQAEALVAADPHPGERNHGVRLFVGSGMPVGTWEQVVERFAPAGVLEFYASTEGQAVLGNLSGKKVGAKGRPLPGSADVALVRLDPRTRLPAVDAEGWAMASDVDEPGLLIARVRRDDQALDRALRGVFEPGDAWLMTGDVFRRDEDGDHWLLGNRVSMTVRDDGTIVWPQPIEDALSAMWATGHVLVHRVTDADGHDVVVASIAPRGDREVERDEVVVALASIPPAQRPDLVTVIEEMPLTTWHRARIDALTARGVPTDPIWRRA